MWLTAFAVLAVCSLFGIASAGDDGEVNVEADYLGCYRDDKAPPLPQWPYYPFYPYWRNWMKDRALAYPIKNFFGSKKNCIDACANKFFKYAGLQAGYLCFCGNDFNKYGRLDDKYCNIKCRDNKLSIKHLGRTFHGEFWKDCGGIWANSVYSTYGVMEQEHRLAPPNWQQSKQLDPSKK